MKIWKNTRLDAAMLVLSIAQFVATLLLATNWKHFSVFGWVGSFVLLVFMTVYNIIVVSHLFTHVHWFESPLLNGLVSVVGVIGGYVFNVMLQHGTPGAYIQSFTALAQLPDLYVGEVKALLFGAMAALVASYKGLNPKGGPKGVGDAVNQSVIIAFMLLFVINFVITQVYFTVIPPKIG